MSPGVNGVVDLMHRYAEAMDFRNWDLLATCFTSDAVAVYRDREPFRGAVEIMTRIRLGIERLDATQHLMSNFAVTEANGSARFQCYVHATHVRRQFPGGDLWVVGGHYDNEAVRTTEGWRMSRLVFSVFWDDGNSAIMQVS